MDDDRSILKRGAKRTLWLRAVHGQHADVVVKRFHAPGLLDRLRDPHRARSEQRTLQALFARGLPVPEPLGIERHAAGVDLVMRSIDGARSLTHLLRDPAGRPCASRIARSIGILLARASLCGLRHPDLHAGNVLVDGDGRAWLVDLRGARLGGTFDWNEHERALVVLAADVRERTDARDRARVLIASLRFLAREGGCRDLPRARDVAQRIDDAARLRRRAVLLRAGRRWMRASSVTRPIERASPTGTENGFLARGADAARCWQLLDDAGAYLRGDAGAHLRSDAGAHLRGEAGARLRGEAGARLRGEAGARLRGDAGAHLRGEAGAHLRGGTGALPFVAGSARSVERAWRTAARLHEHGIPIARPLAMVRGARARAVFGLLESPFDGPNVSPIIGTSARARDVAALERDPTRRAVAAATLGKLLGLLSDRGLAFTDPIESSVTFDARGRASVAIGARVRSVDRLDPQTDWGPVLDVAARATRTERARFLVAWLRAQQLPTRDKVRLRASMRETRT